MLKKFTLISFYERLDNLLVERHLSNVNIINFVLMQFQPRNDARCIQWHVLAKDALRMDQTLT